MLTPCKLSSPLPCGGERSSIVYTTTTQPVLAHTNEANALVGVRGVRTLPIHRASTGTATNNIIVIRFNCDNGCARIRINQHGPYPAH